MNHYRRGDPETGCFLLMLAGLAAVAVILAVLRALAGEPAWRDEIEVEFV